MSLPPPREASGRHVRYPTTYCFGCGTNLNNIDLLLACDYDFRSAVAQLEEWLGQYLSRRPRRETTDRE